MGEPRTAFAAMQNYPLDLYKKKCLKLTSSRACSRLKEERITGSRLDDADVRKRKARCKGNTILRNSKPVSQPMTTQGFSRDPQPIRSQFPANQNAFARSHDPSSLV